MASVKLYKNLTKRDINNIANEQGKSTQEYLNALKDNYVILFDARSQGYRPTNIEGWPIFYTKDQIAGTVINGTLAPSDIIMNAYEWCCKTIRGIE